MRRALLNIAREKHKDLEEVLQTELAKCWLQSAKLARKWVYPYSFVLFCSVRSAAHGNMCVCHAFVAHRSGHLQHACSCLHKTRSCDLPEVFLEKAKWLWAKVSSLSGIFSPCWDNPRDLSSYVHSSTVKPVYIEYGHNES